MGTHERTEPRVDDRRQRKAKRDRDRLPAPERQVPEREPIELEPELVRVIELATD